MRVFAAAVLVFPTLLAVAAGGPRNIKLRGYITELRSQNSFDIDDYRVSRESTLSLEFEKDEEAGSEVELPGDLRIGSEVEIKGEYDTESHQLTARSIKIFPGDTRKVKRTAILETPPRLERHGTAWSGTLRADGQLLVVDEDSKLSIVANRTQSKAEKSAAKAAKQAAKNGEPIEPTSVPLGRPDDVHANMYVSYEGAREQSGSIRVAKAEFKDNERTSGEAKLWKSLTPKVTAFKTDRPGEVRIAGVGKFKTIPNDDVQQYVRRLATQLLPANQRELPDGNENKIPLQVFVIEQKVPNASALPNGTVLVHSALFPALENEAQLAFVLGHEIAHATQEHTQRQLEFHKKKRMALQIAAIAASAYGAYNLRD